ncbi:hypothetical protein [Flavobacterium sp. 3HN19-14]|uniref:hypothetical protein n=1 Tax=Flavobacterium sp. 3HN19-14 TaxID=3448133 RepID=UPI003EE16CBB
MGKFALALHDWDEPIRLVTEAAKNENLPLLSPMIGEKVNLDNPPSPENWWKAIN